METCRGSKSKLNLDDDVSAASATAAANLDVYDKIVIHSEDDNDNYVKYDAKICWCLSFLSLDFRHKPRMLAHTHIQADLTRISTCSRSVHMFVYNYSQ